MKGHNEEQLFGFAGDMNYIEFIFNYPGSVLDIKKGDGVL